MQSDYGVSFLSQATPTFSRRHITIDPVQMRCVRMRDVVLLIL